MKIKIILVHILLLQQIMGQSYQKIHAKAIVIDTHNDILMQTADKGFVFDDDLKGLTHSDLKRWKEGGLDVQLFSVFCDGEKLNPFAFAQTQIDSLDAVIKRNPDKIVKVANSKELFKAVKQNKLAAMIGLEGGHMIENNLDNLDYFYKRGTRYMTLTWNNSNDWATSAFDETFN
jgi:membrane dipeptidase